MKRQEAGLERKESQGWTAAADPIHDVMNQGQGFAHFTYRLGAATRLSLMGGFTVNDGQFPDWLGMPALFQLDRIDPANYPSTAIKSSLEQQDYLGVLALNTTPTADLDLSAIAS